MITLSMTAQSNRYDVNDDHVVNVSDVTSLVDYILRGTAYNSRYDVYEDGQVNVSDVTDLVDYILGKHHGDVIHHEYVDLGLPSGTLWATINVGAEAPYQYGDYFSWGEVDPKSDYGKRAYSYFVNSTYQSIGTNISGTAYDAARYQWGGAWRMPRQSEVEELMTCNWSATTLNGVKGYRVTGPNGNSIFLPNSGSCDGTAGPEYLGQEGYYWTADQVPGRVQSAYCLYTAEYDGYWWTNRYYGFSIRPVR